MTWYEMFVGILCDAPGDFGLRHCASSDALCALYGVYIAAASRCLRAVWPLAIASIGALHAAAILHYTVHAILVALVALHRFEVVDVQRPQYTSTFWLTVISMLSVLRRDVVFAAPLAP